MRIDKILKLAERFYNLTREAGIVEDMAARVLYSTIPVGTDDELALRSLIPGAKRMLHYGAQAILQELKSTIQQIPAFRIEQGRATDSLNQTINKLEQLLQGNKSSFFSQAAELLGSVDAHMFGGPPWIRIALALKDLAVTVDSLGKRGPNQIPIMKQMVAEMNVVDGMAHNTGLLMDKMLDLEANDKNIFDLDAREAKYNKLLSIMDAKELNKPEDVMRVVAPVVEESMPEVKMPFNDVLSRYRSSVRQVEPEQSVEHQLQSVRWRKNLMELRHNIIENKDSYESMLFLGKLVADAINATDKTMGQEVWDATAAYKTRLNEAGAYYNKPELASKLSQQLQELVTFILTRLDAVLSTL